MARLMTHDEAVELLGAYALDAVDPDEAMAIEAHLESCPRCRDELRNHREVTGLLSYAGQEAPAGLWDRVMDEVRTEETPPPSSRPAVIASPTRLHGRDGRARWPGWIVPVVAAAAVLIVALFAVQVARLQSRTDHLSHELSQMASQPTMANVEAALAAPGARRVTLRATEGSASIEAVLLPDGSGYLYDSTLEPLATRQTYQLWGQSGQQLISYGLIGASPAPVTAFRVGRPVQALAISVESAGGVVAPTRSPVVSGGVA
jgi:Anti-sigma-K factor rskA/Putative zinc-finger